MNSQHNKLPAYCTTSVGPPGLVNIAVRLRDLAAFLTAQGLQDIAEHVSRAHCDLDAYLAVPIRQAMERAGQKVKDWVSPTGGPTPCPVTDI